MPRKGKAAVKEVESDGDDDVKQEITVKDEKEDASLLSVVTIPFLTDRVQSEEEIPTYVVEKSKSARAIW